MSTGRELNAGSFPDFLEACKKERIQIRPDVMYRITQNKIEELYPANKLPVWVNAPLFYNQLANEFIKDQIPSLREHIFFLANHQDPDQELEEFLVTDISSRVLFPLMLDGMGDEDLYKAEANHIIQLDLPADIYNF